MNSFNDVKVGDLIEYVANPRLKTFGIVIFKNEISVKVKWLEEKTKSWSTNLYHDQFEQYKNSWYWQKIS